MASKWKYDFDMCSYLGSHIRQVFPKHTQRNNRVTPPLYLVKTGYSITQQQNYFELQIKYTAILILNCTKKEVLDTIVLVTSLKTSLRILRMKSANFHTEISILTFLLLWSVAQLPFCCYGEELQDVQVKRLLFNF